VPPQRPAIPEVKRKNWAKNPIDSFVLARLEQKGLKPAHEADKVTLLRRVTLDLTGLPPPSRKLMLTWPTPLRCLREEGGCPAHSPIMASVWRNFGWTLRAIPTRTATTLTASGRCGPGGLGHSRLHSNMRFDEFTWSRLPVTCFRMPLSIRRWRRASIAIT